MPFGPSGILPYIPPHIEFLHAWGKKGSGAGEFYSPRGVAVDSLDNVYVADFENQRVQKFDGSGKYITEISGVGFPIDVAVDFSGNVYVVIDGDLILKFDNSLTPVSNFGSHGTGDYQFKSPTGVAVDPLGKYVYVADNGNNRILKFASSLLDPGSYLTQWGATPPAYKAGSGDGQLFGPSKVAVDILGNVYVVDSGNNRVQKFDSSGNYVTQWGSFGSGDGQFDSPVGICVYPMIVMPLASGGVGPFSPLPTSPPSSLIDYVIVTDSNNNRVQMFCIDAIAGTSQYLTQWGSSGSLHSQFKQPYGVATFPGFTGSYQYVADQENNRVQKFATILYHPAAIGPWYF